jgi:pyruvate dehydrogenase E1 component alpha subunit
MHLIAPERGMLGSAPIVSGTISLATGAALSSKIRGEKRVTVSFFGDGAAGEGVLYEALNFAALQKLPILFVCENNYYSTHMSIRECRPQHPIVKIGEAFGIESFRIDGNDVLKVYETAKRAIDRCRIGVGPTFLECSTYRFRGHVGPDDNVQGTHTDIRSKSEIEKWMRKDPIKRFERRLFKEEILTKDDVDTIHREAETEIGDAFVFARQSPYPAESELTDYVFKS